MHQERRAVPRLQCYLPVRLFLVGQHRVIQTLTKDLGLGGMRCLSPVVTPSSTPLSLDITLGWGQRPVSIRAQVVWVKEVPHSEQFQVGLVFQDISEEDTKLLSTYLTKISLHTPAVV